jgi:hypothetical protein
VQLLRTILAYLISTEFVSFIEFNIVIAPDDNIIGIFTIERIQAYRAQFLEQRIEVNDALCLIFSNNALWSFCNNSFSLYVFCGFL